MPKEIKGTLQAQHKTGLVNAYSASAGQVQFSAISGHILTNTVLSIVLKQESKNNLKIT